MSADDDRAEDDVPRKPGGGQGLSKARAKLNRQMAATFQGMCSSETIGEYYLAVVMGQNPVLVKDDRYSDGWRVAHDEDTREKPSLDQKMAAMNAFVLRRDGQAPSHVHIQADMRAAVLAIGTGVDAAAFGALPYAARHALVTGIRALLAPPAAANASTGSLGASGASGAVLELEDDTAP